MEDKPGRCFGIEKTVSIQPAGPHGAKRRAGAKRRHAPLRRAGAKPTGGVEATTPQAQEARGRRLAAARARARGGLTFLCRKRSFQGTKNGGTPKRASVYSQKWGRAQLSNPPPIGARTRIPLDTEKINLKKRLFYALLPSKCRKNKLSLPPTQS